MIQRYVPGVSSLLVALAFLVLPALASASVVYNAVPDPLASNYPSQPFQAQQTNEFGDYIHLDGTDRQLTTVTVTMSTWARYSEYTADERYSANATSWTHPITVNIYSNHLGANGAPDTLLASKTQNITIPWRPEGDVSCPNTGYGDGFAWKDANGTCNNGLAFNATFDLSSLNTTLPDDVIVSFVYNTQTYGPSPIGTNGPYNSLNIAVPPSDPVTVGTDNSTDKVFWNTSTPSWYTNTSCLGNTLCEDTNWTLYGTVAMQINAVSSTGSIAITKYACPADTVVTRAANGVVGTAPGGCTPESGATFGYVHGTQTDANSPYPELAGPFVAGGTTNSSGLLTMANLPATGRYLVAETDGSGNQLAAGDILGLYCSGDGDTSGTNDNQELTFVPAGQTVQCVAYNKAAPPPPPASCPDNAAPTLVETVPVDSASVSPALSAASLLNGQQYLLVSSGTWQNSLNVADTEYASTDSWATHMDGYNIDPYLLGAGEFDLQVNGGFVDWGAYNTAHEYSYLYTGTGAAVSLGVFDGDSTTNTANSSWYGDNSGSLSVRIYACASPAPTTGSISGMKFNDLNRNGKKGANEPGLGGWVIRLQDENGHVIATTTTDASGNYTFTNLSEGTYKVREVHQKGWRRVSKNPKPIVLDAGAEVTDVVFGNAQTRRGERDDTDQDDQHDDQPGYYYCNGGHSDYDREQNDRGHQQSDNKHGKQKGSPTNNGARGR